MALGITLWLYILKAIKQVNYKGDERWKLIQLKANNAANLAHSILIEMCIRDSYLVVLLLLKYLVNLQQKRAKEREEEQKKGIIRTHYTIKTEKFLVVAFIVGTIFFACCTAMSLREKEDMFVICIFGTVSYTHLDVYKRQPLFQYQYFLLAGAFPVLWKTALESRKKRREVRA